MLITSTVHTGVLHYFSKPLNTLRDPFLGLTFWDKDIAVRMIFTVLHYCSKRVEIDISMNNSSLCSEVILAILLLWKPNFHPAQKNLASLKCKKDTLFKIVLLQYGNMLAGKLCTIVTATLLTAIGRCQYKLHIHNALLTPCGSRAHKHIFFLYSILWKARYVPLDFLDTKLTAPIDISYEFLKYDKTICFYSNF